MKRSVMSSSTARIPRADRSVLCSAVLCACLKAVLRDHCLRQQDCRGPPARNDEDPPSDVQRLHSRAGSRCFGGVTDWTVDGCAPRASDEAAGHGHPTTRWRVIVQNGAQGYVAPEKRIMVSSRPRPPLRAKGDRAPAPGLGEGKTLTVVQRQATRIPNHCCRTSKILLQRRRASAVGQEIDGLGTTYGERTASLVRSSQRSPSSFGCATDTLPAQAQTRTQVRVLRSVKSAAGDSERQSKPATSHSRAQARRT